MTTAELLEELYRAQQDARNSATKGVLSCKEIRGILGVGDEKTREFIREQMAKGVIETAPRTVISLNGRPNTQIGYLIKKKPQ